MSDLLGGARPPAGTTSSEPQPAGVPPAATRKEVWGWGLYDFANSPFATTILAVIFNRYFVEALAGGAEGVELPLPGGVVRLPGLTLFTYTVAAAMLVVALLAPLLGAIADYSGRKKLFLAAFCYLGAAATAMLWFAEPGRWAWGAAFFFLGQVGFAASNVFYNAFLPEISTEKNIGWISGFGFTLGYLGGSLLLALNLLMLRFPGWLGADEPFAPQDTFLSVAVWWAVFAVPTLLWVRDRPSRARRVHDRSYVRIGLERLGKTFRRVRNYSELSKFLVAFLIYNDGIQTVIVVAAIFVEQELGLPEGQVVGLFLVIQMTAFLGAILLGALSDRLGCKQTVVLTLLGWVGVAVWGWRLGFTGEPVLEVWAMGIVVGLILGGSQSASRALQGSFTPDENSAEFFSFYGIVGKFSAVLGPFTYGSVYAATRDIRLSILALVAFFVLGLAMLSWVDEDRGKAQARQPVV